MIRARPDNRAGFVGQEAWVVEETRSKAGGTRRRSSSHPVWLAIVLVLVACLLGVGLAADAFLIEPHRVVVEEVRVPIASLPTSLEGLRIVHISDLHITEPGRREEEAAALIHQLKPDLIAVTGDLIQHTVLLDVQERWAKEAGAWLASLGQPPLGIWVSRGNTDISRYGDFNNVLVREIEAAGAHVLVNRAQPLRVGEATLWLAGVDFANFAPGFIGDFVVTSNGTEQWLETGASKGNSTLHWWAEEALGWSDYEFSGRLRRDDPEGGIGVTFYSRFPAGYDRYYRLRSYAKQPTFQIAPHGANITAGDVDTGVEALPNRWYRFRIRVETGDRATRIQARVWPDGEPEPAVWQADCTDDSEGRLRAGTIGLWGLGEGSKRFDELTVRPLHSSPSAWFAEDFEARPAGERPAGWIAYGVNKGNVEQALAGVPREAITILLAHSPDQALEAMGEGVELVLSGHTHGGQVRLPFIGALYTGTALGRRYAAGLFRLDGLALYVTRGIGTQALPVRFQCPPEVTVLILEGGDQESDAR